MKADNILFRPSSMGNIMSGVAKGWDVDKSLTCKRELISIWRQLRYGRYYSSTNKYTEKGTLMETDGINLYARHRRMVLKKNEERLTNDFFTGVPDIILDEEIIDIKCPWSLDSLPHKLVDDVLIDYDYQGSGYIDLCDKDKYTIAYCLVNAPANLITSAKDQMYYKMGKPDKGNPALKTALATIEKNMIFDLDQFVKDNPNFEFIITDWEYDIPMKDRIVEYVFNRNDEKIKSMKTRINDSRTWMNKNLFQ